MHHDQHDAQGVNSRPLLTKAQINLALDLTAHYLPSVLSIAVKLLALSALFWGALKVFMVADQVGITYALVFSGMHLPFCFFGVVFVLWFFDHYQGIGYFALFFTALNALLI
ncbi:MAG: hypothetical protein E6Q83_18195 [Thiothrix sp.]|nr:MAG: hypothetical protein E6Q83_18195 [Thiothrix sp.]